MTAADVCHNIRSALVERAYAILRGVTMLAFATTPAIAQDARLADSSRVSQWIVPASDAEGYLRYLQTLGEVRQYPWSIRGFSAIELRTLSPTAAHPWSRSSAPAAERRLPGGARFSVAPAELHSWYNTTFPYGMNDGAVWTGRGLTVSGTAGVAAEWGPATLTLAPVVFWTENRAFPLTPVNTGATSPYQDPLWPKDVDRPQRFGDHSYGRLDAGNSSLRLDAYGVAAGVSNANEWWGPMSEFPLILGNNAPGFAHVFVGSSHPLSVYVGRVHGRVIFGQLMQSAWSPQATGDPRRFASGMVATFEPRFMPGLEVGATRFYHVQWPDRGLTAKYFTHLFESFLKQRVGKVFSPAPLDPNTSTDNQLASLFARWALPHSGFEMYGEYGREDHNANARDAILEADHAAAYGLGARKAWLGDGKLTALRAEIVNFQASTLARHRGQYSWFRHTFTVQGHTNRGQLLASGFAVGSGAATTLAFERMSPAGSSAISWSRYVVSDPPGTADDVGVQNVLRAERGWRASNSIELRAAVDAIFELNRGKRSDQGNARMEIALVWHDQ